MKEQLSNLVRDPQLEKLGLSLKSPNFFSILRITQTETCLVIITKRKS